MSKMMNDVMNVSGDSEPRAVGKVGQSINGFIALPNSVGDGVREFPRGLVGNMGNRKYVCRDRDGPFAGYAAIDLWIGRCENHPVVVLEHGIGSDGCIGAVAVVDSYHTWLFAEIDSVITGSGIRQCYFHVLAEFRVRIRLIFTELSVGGIENLTLLMIEFGDRIV